MPESKVVVVTGAAMGICRQMAHTFAQAGAKLALVDIASLDKVFIELREKGADVLPASAGLDAAAGTRLAKAQMTRVKF